jgi:TPR repeat protein
MEQVGCTVGSMRPSGQASAATDASIARADWPRLAFEPKPGAPPHSCGVCGKPEALMCKACRTAYFCSVDCQTVAWRGGHKAECRERAAMNTELLRRKAVDEDVSGVARARSLYELACSHLEGIGCAADKAAYIRTLREAVAAGSHDASALMATYFRDGNSELGVARNSAEYVRLLKVAAESEVLLRGEPTVQPAAQHELGLVFVRGKEAPADLAASVRYFKRAADAGFALAELSYGLSLLDGSGTARNAAEGVLWLRRAAAKDLPDALYNLGCCLFSGEGATKDQAEANALWRRGMALGNAECAFNLGNSLLEGTGTARDVRAACECFAKANEIGHPSAGDNLCAALSRAAETALVSRQLAFLDGLKRASGGAGGGGGGPALSAEQRKRAVRAYLLSPATREMVFGRA